MLLMTSLKSSIPRPSNLIGVVIMDLLIRSGAFLLSRFELHINLYISSFIFFSILSGIRTVDAMKSICDRPKVLKIVIFPRIERYMFFHNLSCASRDVKIFCRFRSLASALSKLRFRPLILIIFAGLTVELQPLYFICVISSSLNKLSFIRHFLIMREYSVQVVLVGLGYACNIIRV